MCFMYLSLPNIVVKKSVNIWYIGEDDESLDQPENVTVAEQEVEILTLPVDENLFTELQVAVNSMWLYFCDFVID